MKILATGDIHSDLSIINQIDKNVNFEKIDLVLLIGDLSEKKDDFYQILKPFLKNKKEIFMTKGNHETNKKLKILKEFYNIKILDEKPEIINNIGFFSPKYITVGPLRKDENKTLESIFYNFYKINKKSKLNIFLSHIPPIGTKIGNSSPFFPLIGGNFSTRLFLEKNKIDLTLVGHIHESSGELERIGDLENLILNVGKTYKIIEIDKEFNLKILN